MIRKKRKLLSVVKSVLEEEFLLRDAPDAGGYRVFSYIKRLPRGADIRVCRFAPTDSKEVSEIKEGKIYFKKPGSRGELAQSVKEILGWN
jgi:hypothetical protein